MEIPFHLLTLMLFQTHKISGYLWTHKLKYFNKTWQVSVPSLKVQLTKTYNWINEWM